MIGEYKQRMQIIRRIPSSNPKKSIAESEPDPHHNNVPVVPLSSMARILKPMPALKAGALKLVSKRIVPHFSRMLTPFYSIPARSMASIH